MVAKDDMSPLEEIEDTCRVLSIQSHTVHGYCGNKSAVFPLQTLGFDVDVLNTVQFSNHTGYPSFTGKKFTAEDVQSLFDGLEANGLTDDYTHILTGYIGNFEILKTIEKMVIKLKSKNPDIIYVCDTVMGDCGELYVAPELVPLYKHIIQYADIITPNQFEAETLSEMKIQSLQETCQAAKKLHQLGSKNIVITSLNLPLQDIPVEIHIDTSNDDSLYCFTSQELLDGTIIQHLISFPTYTGYFTGTGDLFASLVVARIQESIQNSGKTNYSLVDAVYRVVCSVNHIAKMTYDHQKKILKDTDSPAEVSRTCELRLIQGKKAIEEPEKYVSSDIIKSIKL